MKINPVYFLKYHSLDEGATNEKIDTEEYRDSFPAFNNQTRAYCDKKAVFERIRDKVEGNFVAADSNRFASEIYAQLKILGVSTGKLLKVDEGIFQDYKEMYSEKGADEHLQLTLDAALYHPKTNVDLRSDDYEG